MRGSQVMFDNLERLKKPGCFKIFIKHLLLIKQPSLFKTEVKLTNVRLNYLLRFPKSRFSNLRLLSRVKKSTFFFDKNYFLIYTWTINMVSLDGKSFSKISNQISFSIIVMILGFRIPVVPNPGGNPIKKKFRLKKD